MVAEGLNIFLTSHTSLSEQHHRLGKQRQITFWPDLFFHNSSISISISSSTPPNIHAGRTAVGD